MSERLLDSIAVAPPADRPLDKPGPLLTRMLLGNRVQQAIFVAAKLGVADALADGPKHVDELARAADADPSALRRLLRALASVGVFAEDAEGQFELTPVAELLRAGTRQSKRAFALWSGGVSYQLFGGLEYSVRTGKPAFDELFEMTFFDYLSAHTEVGDLFDEFMARQTAPLGPVLAEYDLSGVETIVDVGGGRGELLAAILRAHPVMRGVLVDVPRVVEVAANLLEAEGLAGRCTTVAADIAEAVPAGGDAYLLKHVVHGLDDNSAARVLANCRRAMNEGGRLLLVEFVMPPGNEPHPAKLMDLLMLVGCTGRERGEYEFRALFDAAGLRQASIVTTKYGFSVIEARIA